MAPLLSGPDCLDGSSPETRIQGPKGPCSGKPDFWSYRKWTSRLPLMGYLFCFVLWLAFFSFEFSDEVLVLEFTFMPSNGLCVSIFTERGAEWNRLRKSYVVL